jgi:CRP-like cAMP-binding protein
MPIDPSQLSRLVPLTDLDRVGLERAADIAQRLDLRRNQQIYAIDSKDDYVYYLLEGEVAMLDRNGREARLKADSLQARFAFGNLKPRPANARVVSDQASLLRFETAKLDALLSWREQMAGPASSFASDGLVVSEMLSDSELAVDDDWVMTLLCSPSFYDMPPEIVHKIGQRMTPQPVEAGERIIQQGDEGDYYYVIREGRARVICNGVTLAELEPMAAFGEEALASGAPRNASVDMITDGLLMRLSQADFQELLAPNLIVPVSLSQTKRLLKEGAYLVDVRSPEEFAENRLLRSINLPLLKLRRRLRKLDHNRIYIVYCDNGKRSAAGCFLMAQKGFKCYLLQDPQRAFTEIPGKID